MTGATSRAIRVLWVGVEPTDYLRDEIDELEAAARVEVQRVFLAERLTQHWARREEDRVISTTLTRLPSLRDMSRFIWQLSGASFDLALLEGYSPWQMILLALILDSRGTPFVLRSDTPAAKSRRSPLKQFVLRWMVHRAAWCLPGGTPQLANLLEADANPRSCSIGFMTVNTHRFCGRRREPPVDRLKVVGVGRLIERKGWAAAIRAVLLLNEGGNRVELDLLGDGPLRTELERLAAGSPAVRIHGAASQDEVAKRLAAADVFILPAKDEPWGLVVNEAMAAGLPVIVGRWVGCVPDLVSDSQSGLLIDPDEDESIRAALQRFIDDPSFVSTLSEAALRTSLLWSPQRRLEATQSAFEHVAGVY